MDIEKKLLRLIELQDGITHLNEQQIPLKDADMQMARLDAMTEKQRERDSLRREITQAYNNLVAHHRFHHTALEQLMA